mgnify:CR=1 FL=1
MQLRGLPREGNLPRLPHAQAAQARRPTYRADRERARITAGRDAWFDVKVIYQQDDTNVSINAVPAAFKPAVGPFKPTYLEKVFGTDPALKIVSARSGRHFQPEAAAHAAQNFGS